MNQTDTMKDLNERTAKAVAHYWQTRAAQRQKQVTIGKAEKLRFEKADAEPACMVREESALYEVRPAKKRLE